MFYSCAAQNIKPNINSIKRIKIAINIGNIFYNNEAFMNNIDFYISYHKQYSIYEFPYHKQKEVNGKLIYDSVKYNFLVLNNSTRKGYYLKNATDSFKTIVNADSVIQKKMLNGYDFYNAIKNKDSVIMINDTTSAKDVKSQIIRYRFLNNSISDSIIYYYDSSFNDISFSFSPYLDSLYNKKLYKIELFHKYNPKTTPIELRNLYKNHFKIIRIPVFEQSELMLLFKKMIDFLNITYSRLV